MFSFLWYYNSLDYHLLPVNCDDWQVFAPKLLKIIETSKNNAKNFCFIVKCQD